MTTTPDMATIKARIKATWMAGDYGTFAQYLGAGALEILAGRSHLAVACSTWVVAQGKPLFPRRALWGTQNDIPVEFCQTDPLPKSETCSRPALDFSEACLRLPWICLS